MSERNEIVEYAKKKDAELKAFDLRTDVIIRHGDGTLMQIRNALLEVMGDPAEWVVIFAEHFDPLILNRDDLDVCIEVTPGSEGNPVGLPPLRRFDKD